ncbi:hypothetical protein [Paenibacillus wynnii]|uniref:VCBS repeat-containing protein n=1 Tax=Paenibacillus wynnii TaxID=268407 RepID=A0A098M6U7_9BACL|nr:hypothetical protein [Paenibacillus wynnii]KGE17267.1 hypothetical protein PWYN_21840 [Paenibacillus wynnii]
MKLRGMRHLLTVLLAMSVLSGCTSFISDPVSRMTMPELSEDKATLMTAINTLKPVGSLLIRPTNDDDSSIFTEDLNDDGVPETIVFYQTPGEAVQIHGMILENQGSTWVKKLVFDGEGTVLESVVLKDLTNDGKLDIVAGFSRGDEGLQKGLVVYSYSGSSLGEVLQLSYTKYVIDDLNGDGIEDITAVSLKRNEIATVTTYQYADGFQQLDKLDTLDPYINNYYNIVAGKVAEDKEGIVLDAAVNAHSASSYIVVMENNKLRVVVGGNDRTFRDRRILSQDIDGDGIIEIGILEAPKGWEYFDPNVIPYFTSYYKWDGKTDIIFSMQQYRDPSDRFYIDFPPEWYGKVTLDTKSIQDEYLKFMMSDSGETVAEVSFFSLNEWERVKDKGWELWGKDTDKVIGYRGKLEQTISGEKKAKNAAPMERKGIDE